MFDCCWIVCRCWITLEHFLQSTSSHQTSIVTTSSWDLSWDVTPWSSTALSLFTDSNDVNHVFCVMKSFQPCIHKLETWKTFTMWLLEKIQQQNIAVTRGIYCGACGIKICSWQSPLIIILCRNFNQKCFLHIDNISH